MYYGCTGVYLSYIYECFAADLWFIISFVWKGPTKQVLSTDCCTSLVLTHYLYLPFVPTFYFTFFAVLTYTLLTPTTTNVYCSYNLQCMCTTWHFMFNVLTSTDILTIMIEHIQSAVTFICVLVLSGLGLLCHISMFIYILIHPMVHRQCTHPF